MSADTDGSRISVIIPVVDEADALASTLPRLASMRRAGHEVILVDGGSRDATRELAMGWVDRVVDCEPGRARQMNAGAGVALGGVLVFLHADTVLPDAADQLIAGALSGGDRCWGRFDVVLGAGDWRFRVIEWFMNLRSRLSGVATGDQAIFVTRQAFDRVGGYPDIPLMEDIAISARLKTLSPPACLRAQVLTSARRWREKGIVRTVLLMWRLRLAYACGADPQRLARLYQSG
jgi:rSAM/selenodomain-associated transferase 2